MPEVSQDQVAVVIEALTRDCKFEPDEEKYILEEWQYVTACEHVDGWGWSVWWYLEDGVIYVNAEVSKRVRLMPKIGK
jgi:hypothetical protein